jgi:cold-inducible RNA-binding protein
VCYNGGVFDSRADLGSFASLGLNPRSDPAPTRYSANSEKKKMKNIYVGNLSFATSEETVRSLFEAHGNVDRVNIARDRDSGQPRGFGFVEMTNDSEAEQAMTALNGRDIDGRTLSVNEARPKTERSSGGGNRSSGDRQRRW